MIHTSTSDARQHAIPAAVAPTSIAFAFFDHRRREVQWALAGTLSDLPADAFRR
jgi:hypothetical protein